MPTRDEHVSQARHNARFYATIDQGQFKDWAVTVLFYVALHYVDALLAQIANIHPPIHGVRDNWMSKVAELKPIYSHYRALKTASHNSRYIPPTSFTNTYVQQLENTHLAKIKSQIGRYLTV